MTREPGFYWIKYEGRWQPAEWTEDNTWDTLGWDVSSDDDDLEAIGPRLEPPSC